jgi:Skp family chaperone for outer membrane proteins
MALNVQGDVRRIDNGEYRAKLLKEALNRANQQEKQQYTDILHQKQALSAKLQDLSAAHTALNEKDQRNVPPEKPSIDPQVGGRQNKTADYNAKTKRYREELKAYNAQNTAILQERINLIAETLQAKASLDALGEKEKWLLLTMALRSQTNLLNFIQKEENNEATP